MITLTLSFVAGRWKWLGTSAGFPHPNCRTTYNPGAMDDLRNLVGSIDLNL